LALYAKNIIRNDCFKFCSNPEKGIGGRYRMDKAIKRILLEANSIDTSFPRLKEFKKDKLKVKLKGKEKNWEIMAKCDVAYESEEGRRILVEVKGYGADTNSLYSAILAAKIVKADEDFRNCLFYYFSTESRSKLLEGKPLERSKIMQWAEETGVIDGFYGIEDLGDLFNEIAKLA